MYSQLHTNAFHNHDHEHDCHTTSRLQPTRQWVGALPQSHPGLCGTPVSPGKDTRGTRGPARGKAVGRGWPTTSTTTTDKRPHDKDRSEPNVLSATSADTHVEPYTIALNVPGETASWKFGEGQIADRVWTTSLPCLCVSLRFKMLWMQCNFRAAL